jgi:RNA polymerase sigma factor (sigma-70 family)
MEEKKKRRSPNRVNKGEFFRGIEPLTDAQRSFVAEWYPWAMKYAITEIQRRKKKNDSTPPELIIDTSVTTLMYAAVNWNPDGGSSFKTYFHYGFYSNVSNAVKKYYDDKAKAISENQRTKVQHEEGRGYTTVANTLYSNVNVEESVLADIYVDDMLSSLTPYQRDIVTKCYLYGERQSDVAEELGVTRQAVNQALNYAKKTLRKVIGDKTV